MTTPDAANATGATAAGAAAARVVVHVQTLAPPRLLAAIAEDRLMGVLTDDEHARRARFHFQPDRDTFLTARVLLRCALSAAAADAGHGWHDPRQWRLAADDNGKPFLDPPAPPLAELAFNISHTRRLVACAIAWGQPVRQLVGVDVEDTARPIELDAIARRFFAPAEAAEVERAHTEPEKRRRFFRYWTLKEAFVKARGEGIRLPLESFAFSPAGAPPALASVDAALGEDADAWAFLEGAPAPEHLLAVAVPRPPAAVTFAVREADVAVIDRLVQNR